MLFGIALLASLLGEPTQAPGALGRAAVTEAPATKASGRLVELVEEIRSKLVHSAYRHRTSVRRREGVYLWDCSGMMNWLLDRAAPRAREALDRDRPVAATYHRVIERAPSGRSRNGWQRIPRVADARPGDVFAWLRPPDWPRGGNTGHVGIVLETPRRVAEIENGWAFRVADASRYTHEDDSRDPDGEGGFGIGTILFVTDDAGAPRAYGWFGSKSRWVHETSIVLGRVTR